MGSKLALESFETSSPMVLFLLGWKCLGGLDKLRGSQSGSLPPPPAVLSVNHSLDWPNPSHSPRGLTQVIKTPWC